MTVIYNYHHLTKEFVSISVADADPLEKDGWLFPANSTTKAPPTVVANEVALFIGDTWSVVPDHRGETWWTTLGESSVIEDIGNPVGRGLQKLSPPVSPKTTEKKIQEALGTTETPAQIARTLEDLITAVKNGNPVSQRIKDWATDRQSKRTQAKALK